MVWYMIPVVRQRSGKVPPRNEREESNPERSEGGGYCRKTPNRQTHRTAPQDLVGLLPQVNPLTLKTAEEVFGNGVIVGITSAGHALADTIGHQPFQIGPGRILHTPVTVEDKPFWRLAAAVCHFQGRKRQLRVDPPRDLKQALRMRTPQSSWYTGLLRLPDKASLRRWVCK